MDPMENGATAEAPPRAMPAGEAALREPDFEAFFLQHHVELFRAVWLLVRDRHEAEEIMQDAFVRLWDRWPRVNVFRSRRRRALVAVRRAVGSGSPPPGDELDAVVERDTVVRTLASLAPRQRAAVVLVDVLGLTSVQAAEALGVRPATVRVSLGRAHATLRKEMDSGE
jgi:DNA-directed RNA polymerase specialized sigma24 family protein